MREYIDNDGAWRLDKAYQEYLSRRKVLDDEFTDLQNNSYTPSMEAGSDDGWMETFTGKKFYPLNPRVEDVDILDIAHSLSLQCRYSGHCRFFYSVAAHSCVLSDYCSASKREALIALLHDASETYFSDIPRPIKYRVKALKDIETKLDAVVLTRFGLEPVLPKWLKEIDSRILCDERLQVMSSNSNIWITDELEPLGVVIPQWEPKEAEVNFLERFYKLYNG
jgi:hypothetical protein